MKPSLASCKSSKDKEVGAFEWVACEICGSDRRCLIASRTDLFLGGETVFSIYECESCHVLYQYPRPTPKKMVDYYPVGYQQYTKALGEEKWFARLSRRYGLQKRARLVTNEGRVGLCLDVGCATGDFLSVLAEVPGWQVFGIEPTHSALKYAREKVGLTVVEGVLNVAPFVKNSFDAITMWDVLEHVYNPRLVLEDVARLLKPGGLFIINHPNLASIDRKLFGNMWLGYELPRHLYLFPPNLLHDLMAELGFQEVERNCTYGSHAATVSSVMFIVEKWFKNGFIVSIIRKSLFNIVTRMLCLPYFKFIDRLNLGSNITSVFIKNSTPDEA